jgi:hypothetical protein
MRKTVTALAVACVLLVSACGDDGGDESEEGGDGGDQAATNPTMPEQEGEFAEFCEQVVSATSSPPDIEPPAEIAESWRILTDAYEAQQNADPADPATQEEMTQMQEEAAPATQEVTQFLQDNCNLPGEEDMPDASEMTSTTAAE